MLFNIYTFISYTLFSSNYNILQVMEKLLYFTSNHYASLKFRSVYQHFNLCLETLVLPINQSQHGHNPRGED